MTTESVQIPNGMLESKAYRDLKPSAAKALWVFMMFAALSEPRGFYLYYRKCEKYGFSNASLSKIIKELMGKGFIDRDTDIQPRFELSERWKDYGQEGLINDRAT